MGIFDRWHEARGTVMRKEFEDAMARMRNANEPARRAFLNNIHQTIDDIVAFYTPASPSERRQFLKQSVNSAGDMWNQGDWPSALGLGISCLHAESRFVPGDDAAYVRQQTERLIREAAAVFETA